MSAEMWIVPFSPDLQVILIVGAVLSLFRGRAATIAGYCVRYCLVCGTTRLAFATLYGLLFAVVGTWTHPEVSASLRTAYGITDGLLHSLVWSPGVGLVACAIFAHHRGKNAGATPEC